MGRFEWDGKRNQFEHSIEIFASYFNPNLPLGFKTVQPGLLGDWIDNLLFLVLSFQTVPRERLL